MNKTKAGFTLLELLTVIAIISMLAAMIFPTLGKVRTRARISKAISELSTIKLALTDYYTEYSAFPTNFNTNGLEKLVEEDYLDTVLVDAFNSPEYYKYYSSNDSGDIADSCIVFSVGSNGVDNGATDFEKALDGAYPGLKDAPPDLDKMPDSDNIYLFMTNSSRSDPLAVKEGDIRYKK